MASGGGLTDVCVALQVFTNKAIFSDPSLKLAQLTFAAFHFSVTWLTLYVLSRPRFAFFVPRRVAVRDIVPLAVTMSLNVILPNLSLAFSTVTFYQVARILLTPCVAAMNYVLYQATLPLNAVVALVPACLGVGMVSFYDSQPAVDAHVKTTSGLGVVFAFAGIFASSLYTVWVASYHRKLQMSSMQLLFNQAPASAFLLLYVIPFVDNFPVWSDVPVNRWVMILMVRRQVPATPFCSTPTDTALVRSVCLPDQHLAIFHHCPDGPRLQYRRRPRQDMHHCCPGLGDLGQGYRRQVRSWHPCCPKWHYCVCHLAPPRSRRETVANTSPLLATPLSC